MNLLKIKYFLLFSLALCASAQVRRVTLFRDYARNASWSPDGSVLFEQDSRIVLAGATPSADHALTGHGASQPQWHPGGRYFAFASAGRIYFMDPATSRILQTIPAANPTEFRFSRDGATFAWMDSGSAHLQTGSAGHVLRLPPDITLVNLDDFSEDGRSILITGHSKSEQNPRQSEIYLCALEGASCRALTHNPMQRQDVARLSPSGRNLVFASSETAWVPEAPIDYESDLWLQPLGDAARALRMTWFGEPANPRYDPAHARITSISWNHDGTCLLATLTEGPHQDHTRILKIQFPEPE